MFDHMQTLLTFSLVDSYTYHIVINIILYSAKLSRCIIFTDFANLLCTTKIKRMNVFTSTHVNACHMHSTKSISAKCLARSICENFAPRKFGNRVLDISVLHGHIGGTIFILFLLCTITLRKQSRCHLLNKLLAPYLLLLENDIQALTPSLMVVDIRWDSIGLAHAIPYMEQLQTPQYCKVFDCCHLKWVCLVHILSVCCFNIGCWSHSCIRIWGSVDGISIMADHGFMIKDMLQEIGVELNIPPFMEVRWKLPAEEVQEGNTFHP